MYAELLLHHASALQEFSGYTEVFPISLHKISKGTETGTLYK